MGNPFALDFRAIPPLRFNLNDQAEDDQPDAERDDARGDVTTGKAGRTFLARVSRRRLAGVKRAADVLDVLPGPGESLHAIIFGFFDLLNVVLAFLDKAGSPCSALRIATLSLSRRNALDLAALLDTKAVGQLDVLTSDFQRKHDPEILAEALAELAVKRGQRIAAARSHCKIVTLALADGRRYVLEGSANLRTSRNMEQFALSQDVGLHAFYDGWLTEMVTKHEIRQGHEEQAG
jgi:hypothetical protein